MATVLDDMASVSTNHERPVVSVIQSISTLEGGGFDGRHPWRPPLRGALRASNFAPGEIVRFADRTLRVLAS
jgi:hypothetical protein